MIYLEAILIEISQLQKDIFYNFRLYEAPRIGEFTKTESRLESNTGWGWGNGELLFNGYRDSVWDQEKHLETDSCDGCISLMTYTYANKLGWYYQFNGHEFEQTPGDREGRGGLACCSYGVAESDMTKWQKNKTSNKLYAS